MRIILIIYLKNSRLIVFSSNKKILLYENILLFTIFLLNSSELLRAIIIFAYMFIQLSIILNLFLRINTLITFALVFTRICNYNEFLIKRVILKTNSGVIEYIENLV